MNRVMRYCGAMGVCLVFLFSLTSIAPKYGFFDKDCFIALENGKIIAQRGDCLKRNSPYCTFNYVLSLIGYEKEILKDEYYPIWPYHDSYVAWFDSWKQDHSPKLWRKNSCVWYSGVLTEKIGMEAIQQYVNLMTYGNRDLSGNLDVDNGLEQPWIESSLEISPYEQVWFVHKMLNREFPLSDHAYDMSKKILYNNTLIDGWELYGKIGSGWQLSTDKKRRLNTQAGWFVGWIEKGRRKIIFAALKKEGQPLRKELVFVRVRKEAINSLYQILKKEDYPELST